MNQQLKMVVIVKLVNNNKIFEKGAYAEINVEIVLPLNSVVCGSYSLLVSFYCVFKFCQSSKAVLFFNNFNLSVVLQYFKNLAIYIIPQFI